MGSVPRQPWVAGWAGSPTSQRTDLLITGLLQNPIFAAFLFLLSYYISSLVTTELTAGKDLHMA